MNHPEIALQKVAPSLAVLIPGDLAVELARKHRVEMPTFDNLPKYEIDTEITISVFVSKKGDGRLWELHDRESKTGQFKGYMPFIRVTDGHPLMPSLTMVEPSLMLVGIEISGDVHFGAFEVAP